MHFPVVCSSDSRISQGYGKRRVAWGIYPFLECELQLTVTALRGTVVAAQIVRHKVEGRYVGLGGE